MRVILEPYSFLYAPFEKNRHIIAWRCPSLHQQSSCYYILQKCVIGQGNMSDTRMIVPPFLVF